MAFYEGIHVSKPKIYTVRLDLTDSNPSTWATYEDAAVGMTAGSDDWDAIFGHYPCILNNGTELGKLKRSDFSKYEDNTSAPITTLGNDVMICFPRRGIKIEKANNDTELVVSLTEAKGVEGFSYKAHTYKGVAVDKFYIGAYNGYVSSDNLYSVSGQTPTGNYTLSQFRSLAQNKGTGYEQSAFFQLTYRQVLYLLKYKGQNAQIAIGKGHTENNEQTNYIFDTGGTNTRGMDWGENTGFDHMKLFGIEDFYGNCIEFVDGIYCDTSDKYKIKVADGNYNDNGTGYINAGSVELNGNTGEQYMTSPNGNNLAGFTMAEYNNGSETTYFCDTGHINRELAFFGGNYGVGGKAGVFILYLNGYSSFKSVSFCSRLMYFPS